MAIQFTRKLKDPLTSKQSMVNPKTTRDVKEYDEARESLKKKVKKRRSKKKDS